jgi:aminoglycoside phosphotransferase (APT) family kinase protein
VPGVAQPQGFVHKSQQRLSVGPAILFMSFEKRLLNYLSGHLGSSVGVDGLRRHTEGFSLETVSFAVSWQNETGQQKSRRLILRREPEAGLLEPYDLGPQVFAMRAVAGTVAVPEVLWFERDPEILDRPFYIMGFVEGEVPLPTLGADGAPQIADRGTREQVAADFAQNLAKLHRFDWNKADLKGLDVPADGAAAARTQIQFWKETIERAKPQPLPMLSRAIRELEATVPSQAPLALVHGDYRTGNFIREGGKVCAVLDWEMVHIGDPLEDLAWAASRFWRGQTDMPGILVEREKFFQFYIDAGGSPLDEARLRFYDLLAAVKMTAIMLTGMRAFADERTKDLRMAIFDHQLSGTHMILAESLGLVGSLTTVESM